MSNNYTNQLRLINKWWDYERFVYNYIHALIKLRFVYLAHMSIYQMIRTKNFLPNEARACDS